MSKTWKAVERRVANFFNSERNPLSGGNSKQTRSDSLHDNLFLETKHRKSMAVWTLFDKTKELARKEGKIPVLALHEKNRKGFLICIHKDDYDKVKSEDRRQTMRAHCECGWSGFPSQLQEEIENGDVKLKCPKCKGVALQLKPTGDF